MARNPAELEGVRGGKIQLCGPDYSEFGGQFVFMLGFLPVSFYVVHS